MQETPIVSICIRRPGSALYRSGALTPYFIELLAEDLRRVGTGRASVVVRADPAALGVTRSRLVPLAASGVRIVFRRERTAA